MIMLVFGFHRPPDFVNGELALPRSGRAGPGIRRDRRGAPRAFFMNAGRPVRKAINVVFTRIVNDYSTVHGTTASCSIRSRSCEPVNPGS